ncbi:MAG: hypothetical protein KDA17_07405 [Candidatus Saccharibacteria bacterium]|nr:hypothetical protein [Candidatus Saccharibacteria bacterium]
MTACIKCGRQLKSHESIRDGIGPVCASRVKGKLEKKYTPDMFSTLPQHMGKDDVILERVNGVAATNVEHVWAYHSPTGFEWGYGGSGPADLALNILLRFGCSREEADQYHQKFKEDFVIQIPKEGGRISAEEIREWINTIIKGEDQC